MNVIWLLFILFIFTGCNNSSLKAPVSVSWKITVPDMHRSYMNEHRFVIKNISDMPLSNNWVLFYSQFPMKSYKQQSEMVQVEKINGTFHRIFPKDNYKLLAPGDSVVLTISGRGEIPGYSMKPEGMYWMDSVAYKDPLPVYLEIDTLPFVYSPKDKAAEVYFNNQRIVNAKSNSDRLRVLPTVKRVSFTQDSLNIKERVHVISHMDFQNESSLLKEKLLLLYGLKDDSLSSVKVILDYLSTKDHVVNDEYYELKVANDTIHISSVSAHGIFNGVQTFLSLFKGQTAPFYIRSVAIKDYPDFTYRGHMQDVARNFIKFDEVKKLIDVLSSYKLNVFRFHFSDDEGWRLQIPGLEELTDVSSRRGFTCDESQCLYPAYGGDFDCLSNTSGNGFYTREEFIHLLRYAAERHVNIIPEIESPGHARAAIVAMKARYNKYIEHNPVKAHEYLLNDINDTSSYVSAQGYFDNVMNVSMPSTYRFIEKVIKEIQLMYEEAGVPLLSIHIGGDEVPEGAWQGSPLCKAFMLEHEMMDTHELSDYFIMRVVSYLKEMNIPFSGWQEVTMGHCEDFDKYLSNNAFGISCWRTSVENKMDELPYVLANKGYPVILSNVSNFYFDLAYDAHPCEPGHNWGGYVDEASSFSMLPFDVYRSQRKRPFSQQLIFGKTKLTKEGMKNIRGVESVLWSETIRNYKDVEYYLFPKLMGLAERGWHAFPTWNNLSGKDGQIEYESDLAFYYARIAENEVSYWQKLDINFRLPYPGVYIDNNGFIWANTLVKGGEIRYTTDGKEPTKKSILWTKPVKCNSNNIKAKLFVDNHQSVTIGFKL